MTTAGPTEPKQLSACTCRSVCSLQKRVPPAEACACSLPPLGSTCCVCVRARMRVHTTVLSHPVSSPALAVLFSFLSPLTRSTGNTHWLPLSSLRSSFRSRGSGGWEDAVQECRPSPGSLAPVSAHYRTEVAVCFSALVTSSRPARFPFFVLVFEAPTWDGNRGSVFGDAALRLCTQSDPCRAVSCLFLRVLRKGLGKREVWGPVQGDRVAPWP